VVATDHRAIRCGAPAKGRQVYVSPTKVRVFTER
jgi:hypothetical protein